MIPVRTETIDILRRLSDFRVSQDPQGNVLLGVASEDGYWLDGQWRLSTRDDRGMNTDQTNVILNKKAADLGLTDPTLAEVIVEVMNRVLSGTLKLVVSVTITATNDGVPIEGAQWSLSEPGNPEPFFVGESGVPYEISIFLNKDFRVYADGFADYVDVSVNLLEDATHNIPMVPA